MHGLLTGSTRRGKNEMHLKGKEVIQTIAVQTKQKCRYIRGGLFFRFLICVLNRKAGNHSEGPEAGTGSSYQAPPPA